MFPKRILQLIMHAAGKGKGGKGGKGQPTALTAAQTTALAARASPNLSSPDDVKKQKMFGKYDRAAAWRQFPTGANTRSRC